MRTLLITTIAVILMHVPAQAQTTFQVKAVAGVSGAQLLPADEYIEHRSALGISATVEALIEIKQLQLGAGVETGTISGLVYQQFLYYNSTAGGVDNIGYGVETVEDIAGPFYAPHLVANYRLDVWDKVDLYAGGAGGLMYGNSSLVSAEGAAAGVMKGQVRGLYMGINAGALIRLGNHVDLDLSESWRYCNLEPLADPVYPEFPYGTGALYPATAYALHYINTSIGLRIKFGGKVSSLNKLQRGAR